MGPPAETLTALFFRRRSDVLDTGLRLILKAMMRCAAPLTGHCGGLSRRTTTLLLGRLCLRMVGSGR